MSLTDHVTFVVAVNDREVLQQNLLASPCLRLPHGHQILIQEKFASAALAYNCGIRQAINDLIIFIHQDMYLPENWLWQVEKSLGHLSELDPDWGVVGCWGAGTDGRLRGHVYSSGLGVLGTEFDLPLPVQTLDEIVLIFRKSSSLSFDETLPHFHFYGTDICMKAAAQGLNCYVIPAFGVHNTRQLLTLPKEFYEGYAHEKRRWRDRLPIHTTCIRISRFNTEVYQRKMEGLIRFAFPDRRCPALRVVDPSKILQEFEHSRS
jgi:hypothetical protein